MNDARGVSELAGRVILIAGANGTLGRVAALSCAAAGATVVLLSRNIPGLEAVYDEIIGAGHLPPAIYPMDLVGANEADYGELAVTLEREFGQLHGLLHHAAALGTLGPIADLDTALFERLAQVNLTAPLRLTRSLLPLLRKSGDASVVFTTDSVARQARAYWGGYGISKIALEGMVRILADELAEEGRVRANVFSPGPVRSRIRRHAYPGENPQSLPPAESLAACYPFLLGPRSSGLQGQIFESRTLLQSSDIRDFSHVRS